MTINDKIKVIIADDSAPFIEGVSLLLSKKPNFELIDICKNGLELVNNENLSNADLII